MKKIYVQIVDSKTKVCQQGMIEESIQRGFEVLNAINHFIKVGDSEIEWEYYTPIFALGKIKDTTKLISVIIL